MMEITTLPAERIAEFNTCAGDPNRNHCDCFYDGGACHRDGCMVAPVADDEMERFATDSRIRYQD